MRRIAEKDLQAIHKILRKAKKLAKEYYQLTEKPLGITGEVAEFEAARLLKLRLHPARQASYDASKRTSKGLRYFQIKGRSLSANNKKGHRLGAIKLEGTWDAVLMVLLDSDFEVSEIWEADREPITQALKKPGSKARNERRAISVAQFKKIGARRWP